MVAFGCHCITKCIYDADLGSFFEQIDLLKHIYINASMREIIIKCKDNIIAIIAFSGVVYVLYKLSFGKKK